MIGQRRPWALALLLLAPALSMLLLLLPAQVQGFVPAAAAKRGVVVAVSE